MEKKHKLQESSIILYLEELLSINFQDCYERQLVEDKFRIQLWQTKAKKNIHQPKSETICFDAHPTWKSTLGPIQKKQSTIRNANTMGILFM